MMSALLGFGALFLLLFWGVPIGFGMGIVGVGGFAMLVGIGPALSMIGQIAHDNVTNYSYSVLPLFIIMGALFAHSRMADDLFNASQAMIGHFNGGLSIATIVACGGFSAVSGSSLACAATMTKVSMPIMKRYNYDEGFAAGTIAAGSTLDILIPPSITMVVYCILTDTDLGKLMMAGFLPGLLTIGCYIAVISVITRLYPQMGPPAPRSTWGERFRSLRRVWAMTLIFTVALGGIYLGVFTPTEAAGVGATGALVLAAALGRLKLRPTIRIFAESARTTSTIFVVLIGALLFANFITASGASAAIASWVQSLGLSQTGLILMLLAIYIVLGCVLDAGAMSVLTVPIFFPLVTAAGIDPIWFGIFVVIVVGIGLIHPPLGLLLFVVKSLVPGLNTRKIFVGVLPFLVADAVRMGLLIAFPGIVLLLPSMMK